MPKILTQCNTADLKFIVGLSLAHDNKDPTPILTKKQKLALVSITAFTNAGLTLHEIYTIKEVLVWDDTTWGLKFHKTPLAKMVKAKLQTPTARTAIEATLKDLRTKEETK